MLRRVAILGWVCSAILAAILFAEASAEFPFRYLQAREKYQTTSHQRGPSDFSVAFNNKAKPQIQQADCSKSQDQQNCILQERATRATEAQAKAADDQLWYTKYGLILVFATLLCTAWAAHEAQISARAAEKSAAISEHTVTRLERPHIFVNVTVPGITRGLMDNKRPIMLKNDGTLTYEFVNYGRTPGQLTDIIRRYAYTDGTMPPPIVEGHDVGWEYPIGVIVANGSPHTERENLHPIWGNKTVSHIGPVDFRFYFLGKTRYKDFSNNSYVIGFCFVFDPVSDQFVRWGDERYNYARQEK